MIVEDIALILHADHDQKSHGRRGKKSAKDYATEDKVPLKPGTTKIPDNHVRFFHYSNIVGQPEEGVSWEDHVHSRASSLKDKGILMSGARGEGFGEPNQIWATRQVPDNIKTKVFVEFSLPHDDERIGGTIGKRSGSVKDIQAATSDATFTGDIKPSDIIAVHEPWHFPARYMLKSKSRIEKAEKGEYDHMLRTRKNDINANAAALRHVKAGRKNLSLSQQIALLLHTPGGKEHDQSKHGRKKGGTVKELITKIKKGRAEDSDDTTQIDFGSDPNKAIKEIIATRELNYLELTDVLVAAGLAHKGRGLTDTEWYKAVMAERERLVEVAAVPLREKTFKEVTKSLGEVGVEGFAASKVIGEKVPEELKGLEESKDKNNLSRATMERKLRKSGTKVQQEAFIETMKELPAKAAERVNQQLKTIKFYSTSHHLTESIRKEYGKSSVSESDTLGGCYLSNKAGSVSELRIDGSTWGGDGMEKLNKEIYAHELAHAYEKAESGDKISDFPSWRNAYKKEIKSGWLTEYAKTSPSEGFAEYSRLVYSDPTRAITKFPRSWAVYKEYNL